MPDYDVTAPNGKTLTITGDRVPTEAELHQIFEAAGVDTKATSATHAAPGSGLGTMADALKEIRGSRSLADLPSERARTSAGAELLPTMGGMAGGAVAGIPGAAVGGAIGEAGRQVVQRANQDPQAPATLGQQAKAIALQGAGQGAGQALGAGAASLAGGMSKWLMNRATSRVSAALMRDFPELSDTLIDHALTISKGGEGQARALLQTAKGKATAALVAAEQTGATVQVELTPDIAESFKTALVEKAIKSGKAPVVPNQPINVASNRLDPATKALSRQIDAAAQGGTMDLTPTQADLLKTQLQKESRALYANRAAPNGPRAMQAEATEKADYASRLNDGLGQIAHGYKAANAEAKPLIGAVRGIAQARRPNGNLYQAMVRPAVGATLGSAAGNQEGGTPGAVAGAVIGAYATSPLGMSQEAILLAHPLVKAAIRQLPKPLASAIVAAISRGEAAPAPTATAEGSGR